MKFIDQATIEVEAGKGGNGACSFLRLKYMPEGGPDGGNGEMVVVFIYLPTKILIH